MQKLILNSAVIFCHGIFKYFLLFLSIISISNAAEKLSVTNLRTEYKVNPLGIDIVKPRLSWEIVSSTRNIMQAAYQIKAAVSEEDLRTGKYLLWDTGKIQSEQSNQIIYDGTNLNSTQKIFWQVRVWANDGNISAWSETAYWEMGLIHSSDWKTEWIEPNLNEKDDEYNPCPFLRYQFELRKKIKSARAYVTSHGLYEFHLNGKKVSNELFTPGWTSYNKRLQYQTYDVTTILAPGKNAIGAILGDGWYRGPLRWDMKRNIYGNKLALLLQINIEYTDGSKEIIGTNSDWKSSKGPLLMSGIYDGETYDARLENTGWDKADFNDTKWKSTKEKDHSKNILVASEGPGVCIIQSLKPVKKFVAANGDVVFDMGQNMVGWVEFTLKGRAGDKITLRHAEVLDKSGNIYTANLRQARQKIEYIFKGSETEIFEPHFTFQGFRYVAVTDYKGDISLDNLTGKVIHSDLKPSGNFTCSDQLINQLQQNILWGLKGNFIDIPTDCPQRDERLGWTADAQVFSPTACFNMDAASFYTKWLRDFKADQNPDGRIPHVIPDVLTPDDAGAAGWADAAVIIPWVLYQNYGDTRILEEQYETIKGWIEFLRKKNSPAYIWNKNVGFADWLAFATNLSDYPGATTDKDLIGTAYFYYSTSILQKIASLLKKNNDADEYLRLMVKIKEAYQKEFITQTGRIASNTQTAYVLTLDFNLIQEDLKNEAAKRLAADVEIFGHITTGFLGTPHLNKILTDCGYEKYAFKLLFNKEYPSWLYPITKGATTIWERWDGIKSDGSFQDEGMNSFNHYAYGAIGKWMYASIAGIDIDPAKPGYKNIIMNPHIPKELTFVRARHHSIYGIISAQWKTEGSSFFYDVEIPANTTADVYLPTAEQERIYESDKPIDNLDNIQLIKVENGRTILHIGSGKYHFRIR